jgi:hypothetical protein
VSYGRESWSLEQSIAMSYDMNIRHMISFIRFGSGIQVEVGGRQPIWFSERVHAYLVTTSHTHHHLLRPSRQSLQSRI